jgi:hypothetical protein
MFPTSADSRCRPIPMARRWTGDISFPIFPAASSARKAAATAGTFYFGHLLYEDGTAYPTEIETGLLRGQTLHVDRFRNRFLR